MTTLFVINGVISDVKSVTSGSNEFRSFKIKSNTSFNGQVYETNLGVTCFKSYLFQKLDNLKAGAAYTVQGTISNRKVGEGQWEKSLNASSIEMIGADYSTATSAPAQAPSATPAAPDDDGIPF